MLRLYNALLLLGFCFISQTGTALAADLADLGRSIYEKGIGRDGRKISATIHGNITLNSTSIACGGCHGSDGRGGGEAFIQVPDIRWLSLSKAYPARRIGAAETPYDQLSFAKVLRIGITTTGRKLDPLMPRFDFADDEIKGLIAYLSEIDQQESAGQSRIVILGILPRLGQNALADTLDAKLKHCPAQENGAPIAAINMLYFDTPEDAIIKLNERLIENPDALVLAPFLPGWELQYANATRNKNVLTILPFSLLNPPNESNWLFPFPGLEAQILALVKSVKAEGYKELRVHSEPESPVSVKLAAIANKIATAHGMLEIADNAEKTHTHAKIATLWLKNVNPDQVDQSLLKDDELMLVPVMFFQPDQVIENSRRNPLPQWRIAYPYNPQTNGNEAWRMPVDVWAGAACKFLSLAGDKSFNLNKLPEILKWEEDLFLYSKPSSDLLSDRVFIYK